MNARSWWAVIVLELAAAGLWLPRLAARPQAPAPAEPPANGAVVLLTDYGTGDPYVGIMKGAILAAAPDVRIFDATHEVPSFDIQSGSYLLAEVAKQWPPGTTFVAVVDPGVGTPRRRIAAVTYPDGNRYIAPDNGLLTDVLASAEQVRVNRVDNEALKNPKGGAATFDGRDWFGPVGGRLAAGLPLEQVGPALDPAQDELVGFERQQAWLLNGTVGGTVVFVDHYGNLLTNIGVGLLEKTGAKRGDRLRLELADRPAVDLTWTRTYAEVPVGELMLTVDNGPARAEIAVNQASAAERLGLASGARVKLRAAVSGG